MNIDEGQNDSNMELHHHGLILIVRWHWGDLGIDSQREISPADEARIKRLARDGRGRIAAHALEKLLGVVAPEHALIRLGEQLVRWAE